MLGAAPAPDMTLRPRKATLALLATAATAAAALTCLASAGGAAQAQSSFTPPPVRHVFVVVLENEDQTTSFGPNSPAPYLARTLPSMGELLPNYYGTGHESNDNYVAMVSGQGPNPGNQSDSLAYVDVTPGTQGADGQATGQGSVYPSWVQTIGNQLSNVGLSWKGYMEDMGNSTTESRTCRHPAPNMPDDTQSARAGDQYAARHNPFVYFHAIVDSPLCNADDVPYDQLAGDLRTVATTPNYSFITPNLCDDGHDSPCVDGRPGGLVSADRFLQTLVPQILASPAYRQDGLLIVTFDESHTGAQACCGEQSANTPNAGATSQGPGGGRVGAVLLSPFIAAGTVDQTAYNHYGLLRSVEDLFGLGHLGYAGAAGLKAFGADVYNATPSGGAPLGAGPSGGGQVGCRARALPRGARGDLRHGALILRAVVTRGRRGRAALRLSFSRSARLYVSVHAHGGGRRLKSRRVVACRTYRVALAVAHGAVTVTATVRGAHERRRLTA
jgi:hypothetical protein